MCTNEYYAPMKREIYSLQKPSVEKEASFLQCVAVLKRLYP